MYNDDLFDRVNVHVEWSYHCNDIDFVCRAERIVTTHTNELLLHLNRAYVWNKIILK